MTSKENYIAFCINQNDRLPLFHQPQWWNCLGNGWDVIEFNYQHETFFMPYFIEKKYGFTFIRNPFLIPYSGPISASLNEEYNADARTSILKLALEQLPKSSVVDLDCNPRFFSEKQNSNTKRTHILELKTEEFIYKQLKDSLKRQIKKAETRLTITEATDIRTVFNLNKISLHRQGQKQHANKSQAIRLFDFCKANDAGVLLEARDNIGNVHSAVWVVYDKQRAYYLMGGSDPEFLGSGSMGYLLWHAIKKAQDMKLLYFDFEGSEQEGVSRFFKTFSATEVHFPILIKKPNFILSLLQKIRRASN